ncbi:hypothetical protein [Pedobacter alluvionis]|uniref:Uncharacterized protein n=1 Tax=Pedobacter alluvionis TaxID=475253 RepID=A0A497XNM9_9SPHI|nr:hypothetical protein [Pedobacter alluvionis]RLJ69615.1 hypothetical protein BCL90_5213 [Pedobacter alluvionis]TFB28330.1 hypothetical protein E3V97_22845 [Pedobacter alluvionis]
MKITPILLLVLIFISCNEEKKINHAGKKKIEKIVNAVPKQAKTDTVVKTKPIIKKTIFPIDGTYVIENDDPSCEMTLMLSYQADQLVYKLTTNKRTLTDKAEIELNESKDGYYLTLKNIEWSENEGTLDDEGEPIDPDITLPTEIQGVLEKNQITIQNTGNVMNYYVKIEECNAKFIRLIKK